MTIMSLLRLCIAVVGMLGLAAPAMADLAPAAPNSGFYVTGGVGVGGWTANDSTQSPTTGNCVICVDMRQGGMGGLLTVGVGYDHQFGSKLVVGAFGDIDFSQANGTVNDPFPWFAAKVTQDFSYYLGVRAGWLISRDTMPYLSVGFTGTHFSGGSMVDVRPAGAGAGATPFSVSGADYTGFFGGIGLETRLTDSLSLRGEYRYAMYGRQLLRDTAAGQNPRDSIRFEPSSQTFRISAVYKFYHLGEAAADSTPADETPANFTGLYASLGGGYGIWTADTTTTSTLTGACRLCTLQTQGGTGPFATFGVGYDRKVADKLIAGVFVDGDLSSIAGSIQDTDPLWSATVRQDRSLFVGGRVGYLLTPSTMPYVSAGYAATHFTSGALARTNTLATVGSNRTSEFTNGGFFVGVGAESRLVQNLFLRAEYRYADFGMASVTDTGTNSGQARISVAPVGQTFRVALVYRFGWLGD